MDRNVKYERLVLTPNMRKFVWKMSYQLTDGAKELGIPGAACTITEHFLTHKMNKLRSLPEAEKTDFKQKIIDDIVLTMMCSVFLSLRIVNNNITYLTCAQFCSIMSSWGYMNVTPQRIFAQEIHMMETSEFKLPLWTGVDIALKIAEAAHMRNCFRPVISAMDAAEYRLNAINDCIRTIIGPTFTITPKHLAAGVVVCVAHRNGLNMRRVLGFISHFCILPVPYIKLIRNIILSNV